MARQARHQGAERIVSQNQARWPGVRIVVRGDSGFCNNEVMAGEDGGIDYILGLAKNPRLCDKIRDETAAVRAEHECTGEDARAFNDFRYKTRDSWSRECRVVGKAEYAPTSCASGSRRSPTSSSTTCVAPLAGTQLAHAQRCRLLKIGAIVSVSMRRIYISLSSAFPLHELFAREHRVADVRDGAGAIWGYRW